jgi:hypothetical protein
VTGRFGERHQDLLEAFLWNAEKKRAVSDGGVEILVDPARVRKTMSPSGYSGEALRKLVNELLEVNVEIKTPSFWIIGGLVDHVVVSERTRSNPLGGERPLWRVRLGVALVELLRQDSPLYYDPTPIAHMQFGISKAVARFALGQAPKEGGRSWALDTMIRRLVGELSSAALRNRRRELKMSEADFGLIGLYTTKAKIHKNV